MMQFDKIVLESFSVTVIGDRFSGKTTLVEKLTRRELSKRYRMTYVENQEIFNLSIDRGNKVRAVEVDITDTPGQYAMTQMVKNRKVDGLILLYDLTNLRSFEELSKWIFRMIKSKKGPRPLLILGNKSDLKEDRRVHIEHIEFFTSKIKEVWSFPRFPNTEIPIIFSEVSVLTESKDSFELLLANLFLKTEALVNELQTISDLTHENWDMYY